MTGRYAETTTVPVEKSRVEIERVLVRYGATAFAYGWNPTGAQIEFAAQGRRIRFLVPLPDRNERRFTHHTKGRRTAAVAESMWEQACRQRWRALALVVKAKLEAVDVGISTFEDEFLGQTVLPSGETVAQLIGPQVADAYADGTVPALLPGTPA